MGIREHRRLVPLWVMILAGIPMALMTWGIAGSVMDGSTSVLQLPLFCLLAYLWLMFLLNGNSLEVRGGEAFLRTGPIWSGFVAERRIVKSDVARLFVRGQAGFKGVREHYLTAELAGGEWVDLWGPFYEAAQAQEFAGKVGWTESVGAEWGVKRNLRLAWVIVGWGLAVAASLAWAGWVEVYLR